VWHYLFHPKFSRFDTIPECDRHTDTHTDTTTAYTALSIASRGKKSLQSMNGHDIQPRSSQLLLLNGRVAYNFMFVDCCFKVFTARGYAKRGICRRRVSVCVSVCVCVCVSVTLRYCIKTAKRRITQTMPHHSPMILVF